MKILESPEGQEFSDTERFFAGGDPESSGSGGRSESEKETGYYGRYAEREKHRADF